jgi:hypothetical protein
VAHCRVPLGRGADRRRTVESGSAVRKERREQIG